MVAFVPPRESTGTPRFPALDLDASFISRAVTAEEFSVNDSTIDLYYNIYQYLEV